MNSIKWVLLLAIILESFKIYSQTPLDNCHVRADLDDLPARIPLDSLRYCNVFWQFQNKYRTHTYYAREMGSESDTGSFMTLYLYRKGYDGYSEVIPKHVGDCYNYFFPNNPSVLQNFYDFPLFMEFPYESITNSFILKCAFDINEKGKYKLIGYYKTICENKVTLHKMDEIYFEVF